MVLDNTVEHPGAIAEDQTSDVDGDVGSVYRHGLKGYSAELSKSAVAELRDDPEVRYIVADRKGSLSAQTIPTGVARIFAPQVPALDIDEIDDARVNVDVAVIDTGIDYTHPDLNVVARSDCTSEVCIDGQGTDTYGHGTHVGGIIGAIDNGFGTVGVAPGARLWAVRVSEGPSVPLSTTLAGIDWVTAHASQIEVANMSIGFEGHLTVMEEAVARMVGAGVVFTVSAGNSAEDARNFSPAGFDDAITVSALSDYDGLPAGLVSEKYCGANFALGNDDRLASYSNWGPAVDIAAPGTCIYSTWPGGTYKVESGTSMAAPTVAGAAAILASETNPNSRADVEAIKAKLLREGSLDWIDTSLDGSHEPLADLRPPGREAVTLPASGLQTHSAQLNGVASPGGLAASYWFEYGTTTGYGSNVPASPKSIGSGTGDLEVGLPVPVEPDTTYHYRLVVSNSAGTSYGPDQQFMTSVWATQPVPPPAGTTEDTEFEDVSCVSKTECVGVGGTGSTTFASRWNGSEWVSMTVPSPLGGTNPRLESVSCSSANACMAVGLYTPTTRRRPFAERWNGSVWTPVSMPTPSAIVANTHVGSPDVSCPSATSCIAVSGYASALSENKSKISEERTLVESWSGGEWTIVPSPNPSGQSLDRLSAVSCSSTSACTAVGTATTSSSSNASVGLAERWNGTEWSLQSPVNPSGGQETVLEDVFCSTASRCMAVGDTNKEGNTLQVYPRAFLEEWNGTGWTLLSGGIEGRLKALSCSSPTSCNAAGEQLLGYHWNGTIWASQSIAPPEGRPLLNQLTPGPEGGSGIEVRGLSCPTATVCTAAGKYRPQKTSLSLPVMPLAERWSGASWSTQSTPVPSPRTEVQLEDVSCAGATECLAVGADEYTTGNLVEAWSGTEWANVKELTGSATAVSCPTTSVCVETVVYNRNQANPEASAWKLVGSGLSKRTGSKQPIAIPAGSSATYLRDISCASSTACTAVGYYLLGSEYKPLAESWNGSVWSLQSVPNPTEGSAVNAMMSVSCPVGTSVCTAVGEAASKPVVYRWSGTAWTVSSLSLPPGAVNAGLEGVSCATSTSCKAVGKQRENGQPTKTLVESWNGTSWSASTSPNPTNEAESVLRSVSCTAASACTAVGNYAVKKVGGGEERKTLIESYNGSEWAIQPSTNPAAFSYLAGVSCSSSIACTAVGRSNSSSSIEGSVPLAERYE
ncbi:MAG: S8 family peptidase [Solirubrobacterales bacterium]